jgi:hypothetical protein
MAALTEIEGAPSNDAFRSANWRVREVFTSLRSNTGRMKDAEKPPHSSAVAVASAARRRVPKAS